MAEKGNIFQKQENRNLGKLSGKVFLFFRTAWQEISTYKKTYFFYMIGLFLFSLQMLKAKYLPIPTVQKDLLLLMPILIILLGMEYLRRHSHKVFFYPCFKLVLFIIFDYFSFLLLGKTAKLGTFSGVFCAVAVCVLSCFVYVIGCSYSTKKTY